MKHLIIAVITALCTLSTAAQNGGQYVENNSVKLQFAGLISGNYYVKIINKKSCTGWFKYDYNGQDKEFAIAANDDTLLKVGTSINGVIKVKNTTRCSGYNDNGWVELCLSVTPLRFVSSTAKFLPDTDQILVEFTVADVSNIDRIVIEVSIDGGKTYRQLGLVWPDPLQPNKNYSVKISAASVRAGK